MQIVALILWMIVFTKKLFLWVWLWQLKEYHIGRFKAHFHTEKGKKLIRTKIVFLKLFVLIGLFFRTILFSYLTVIVFFRGGCVWLWWGVLCLWTYSINNS